MHTRRWPDSGAGRPAVRLLLGGLGVVLAASISTSGTAHADVCPEPNESLASACPLADGASVQGTIAGAADLDTYKIDVPSAGTRVRIQLTDLPADYDLYLYNASVDQLGQSVQEGTSAEEIDVAVQAAGPYYIWIRSKAGRAISEAPYTLKVTLAAGAAPPAASAAAPAPPPAVKATADRPLDQFVLSLQDAGEKAKASGNRKGADARASWYEITYKRDSDPKVAKLGPQIIVNRVYWAADDGSARQIYQEQAAAGLPEAKQLGLGYYSLGPEAMNPLGEEAQASGACGDCNSEDKTIRHYRVVLRLGNVVQTLYTYGYESGNNFNVVFSLAEKLQTRILTPPAGPLGEITTTRQPSEIGLGLGDAGKEAVQLFANQGADGRASWYESRYERGEETIGQKLGPTIIYNKILVTGSLEAAQAIFRENAVLDVPESTQPRGDIFEEPKTKKVGNESYAVAACNTDCNSKSADRLHERLVYRWGNVVVILYIWGRDDQANPGAITDYATTIMSRIQ